jgi:vitamin K-dependent gamma-carboxylase
LQEPVSGASLAVFRITVGVMMLLEAYCHFRPSRSASGKIPLDNYYVGPDIKFNLPYDGFGWLPVLPANAMYALVGLMGLAAMTMALGLFYRASAVIVFIAWGYLYALEATRTYWMSHYYLVLLITFLLIWMPAAQRYSIDALRARRRKPESSIPFWPVLLLRGQLLIAYFYAGVAKLNADWLLDAQPVRYYLSQPHVIAPYEWFLSHAQLEAMKAFLASPGLAYFISWSGAIFDLAVGFLLLVRRTRILGFVLMLIFHTTNQFVLFDDLGLFPLVGVMTAFIFLDTDWPERFLKWMRRPRWSGPDWRWATGCCRSLEQRLAGSSSRLNGGPNQRKKCNCGLTQHHWWRCGWLGKRCSRFGAISFQEMRESHSRD